MGRTTNSEEPVVLEDLLSEERSRGDWAPKIKLALTGRCGLYEPCQLCVSLEYPQGDRDGEERFYVLPTSEYFEVPRGRMATRREPATFDLYAFSASPRALVDVQVFRGSKRVYYAVAASKVTT